LEALADAEVGDREGAGEYLESIEARSEAVGNLTWTGLAAYLGCPLGSEIDDCERKGSGPDCWVQGYDLLVCETQGHVKPFDQYVIDHRRDAAYDLNGGVIHARISAGIRIVCGEKVLIEPKPGIAARILSSRHGFRIHCPKQSLEGSDLTSQNLPETAYIENWSERCREHAMRSAQCVLGLLQRHDSIRVGIASAIERSDDEAISNYLGQGVGEPVVRDVLVKEVVPDIARSFDRLHSRFRRQSCSNPKT